jgi:hypothetical protein
VGSTVSPSNPDFKHLRTIFPHLNLDLVEPNRNNPFTDSFLAAEVAEMERVCLQTLEMPGVRSDYRQYAEVCLDLNSCSLPGGKVFKEYACAAVSECRWMQHPLYTAKIQKYSTLLKFTPEYIDNVRRFNQFQVLFAQFWFTCQIPADVPHNDLLFCHKIMQYETIDKEVAQNCLKTLFGQLWYLFPENAFLSLASEKVDAMIRQLLDGW